MDMTENWNTDEFLAGIAATELATALDNCGIGHVGVYINDDPTAIDVVFFGIDDASALMTLAVPPVHEAGGMYDRATGSHLTLLDLAQKAGGQPGEDETREAVLAGWKWDVHPTLNGRKAEWHVAVEIPIGDAYALTATLNGASK